MNLNEEALQVHKEHNGKLATVPKAKLENAHDLSVLYTPGVAEPCRKIREDKDLSFEYTCRGNMVAVVSDGTRVLGLGNIGPEAGMRTTWVSVVFLKYSISFHNSARAQIVNTKPGAARVMRSPVCNRWKKGGVILRCCPG